MTPELVRRLSLELPDRSPTLPIAEAWKLVKSVRWWARPVRDATIAYVCSCFSELAYLHLTDKELASSGRYKLIPSLNFHALHADGVSFDLHSTVDLDFPSFVFETEQYLYAGFVVGEVALIAVRGTRPTSLIDWRINLCAHLKPRRGARERLHAGYLREAERAAPLIANHIQKFERAKSVRFTGHSLGGAVASVLHKLWPYSPSLGAYAFGAPRIGDIVSVEQSPPFAYRRPWDLVPHVPPKLLGYRDADPEIVLLSDDPSDSAPSLGAVLWDWTPKPGGKPFAIQHSIERYRARLGRTITRDFPELVYWDFAKRKIRERGIPPTS